METAEYMFPRGARYGSPEMRRIWSEEHKRARWRAWWCELVRAQQHVTLVKPKDVERICLAAAQDNTGASDIIEKRTHHDLVSELEAFSSRIPKRLRWLLHRGATSSDIESWAEADILHESNRRIALLLLRLRHELRDKIKAVGTVRVAGKTHLQPALSMPLALRLSAWLCALNTCADEWGDFQRSIRVKPPTGAAGTASGYYQACGRSKPAFLSMARYLTLRFPYATSYASGQTSPYVNDVLLMGAVLCLSQTLHKIAFDIRLMCADGLLYTPRGKSHIASSSMPHKNNPVEAEKICSLSRVVAASVIPLWEAGALSALERTLDDSATRRLLLPQVYLLLDECLSAAKTIIHRVEVCLPAARKQMRSCMAADSSERELLTRRTGRTSAITSVKSHPKWSRGRYNPLPQMFINTVVATVDAGMPEARRTEDDLTRRW